jgi:hypothetical protein
MSNILSFEFEELPIAIVIDGKGNRIEAGLVNGMAEIQYNRSGDWAVESVCLEGYVHLTLEQRAAGKKPWVYVKAPAELEFIISDRLETEWSDKVSDAINEQLASDREDAAEQRAEMRRDEMMGL